MSRKNKNKKKEIGNNRGWANRGEQQTKGGGEQDERERN
jgi:hypothetical protein